jgi:hypothetical protein
MAKINPPSGSGSGIVSIANAATAAVPAEASGTTASTTYVDTLTGAGTAVSVTVTTGTTAIVYVGGDIITSAAGNAAIMSFRVSGATTRAAQDNEALNTFSPAAQAEISATKVTKVTGLTPGSNTFTLQYKIAGVAGSSTFQARSLIVEV